MSGFQVLWQFSLENPPIKFKPIIANKLDTKQNADFDGSELPAKDLI